MSFGLVIKAISNNRSRRRHEREWNDEQARQANARRAAQRAVCARIGHAWAIENDYYDYTGTQRPYAWCTRCAKVLELHATTPAPAPASTSEDSDG